MSTNDDLIDHLKYGYLPIESITSHLSDISFKAFEVEYDIDENEIPINQLSDLFYYSEVPLIFDIDSYIIGCRIDTPSSIDGRNPNENETQIYFRSWLQIDSGINKKLLFNDRFMTYQIQTRQRAQDLLLVEWPKFLEQVKIDILNHRTLVLNNLDLISSIHKKDKKIKNTRSEIKQFYQEVYDYLPTQLELAIPRLVQFDRLELDCLGRSKKEIESMNWKEMLGY